MHTFALFCQNRKIMQKLVPNNVEFNSVCNKKLIHKLNVRDVFVLSKQEINAKK
jgi:hypothetical protein